MENEENEDEINLPPLPIIHLFQDPAHKKCVVAREDLKHQVPIKKCIIKNSKKMIVLLKMINASGKRPWIQISGAESMIFLVDWLLWAYVMIFGRGFRIGRPGNVAPQLSRLTSPLRTSLRQGS